MLLIWEKGLSATSLDDLALAMKMNRPSVYNAFGNKEDIYRKAVTMFCGQLNHGFKETLEAIPDLREGLIAFFNDAIEVYCGTNPSLGCLMICTAPSEVFSHPEVGDDLKGLVRQLDRSFTQRLRRAQVEEQLTEDVSPELTAKLLQATRQTLALRARIGTSKRELRKIAHYAVDRLAGQ